MAQRWTQRLTLADMVVVPEEIAVRRIGMADLRRALRRGIEDFLATPTQLIFLGVIYPLVGLVAARATYGGDLMPLFYPLVAGLAFLGPVVAVGLYELSRRREQGLAVSWTHMLDGFRTRAIWQIAALALVLLTLFVAWLGTAQLIYEATLGRMLGSGLTPAAASTPALFLRDLFGTVEGWQMIVAGNLVGALFGMLVLSLSVVSFPMMLDRGTDAVTAVQTSLRAVMTNPLPMLAWGVVVTFALLLGSLPAFVGLAVVMPVLGHATWHLYRRVVG